MCVCVFVGVRVSACVFRRGNIERRNLDDSQYTHTHLPLRKRISGLCLVVRDFGKCNTGMLRKTPGRF